MSLRGSKVPRLTVFQIRRIVERLRAALNGQHYRSIGHFLEWLIFKDLLEVVSDDSDNLPVQVEAGYDPVERCILIRDSDYRALCEGTRLRSKFTFWHEFGHLVLNHKRVLGRARAEDSEHSFEEDSEWQANTFAAEMLMPYSVIKGEGLITPEQVMSRFKVSYSAAKVRLKAIKEEGL